MPEIPVCGCYNFPQPSARYDFHTRPLWHLLTLALDTRRLQALVCWHPFWRWRAYWSQGNRVLAVALIDAPMLEKHCPGLHPMTIQCWPVLVPRRGIEPRPRRWERRILTTRPPGRPRRWERPDGIVVSIPACHAGDRGSIPCRGANCYNPARTGPD